MDKVPKQFCWISCFNGAVDLQNDRVFTCEGYFGFHRVANAKENRPSERT